MTFLNKIKNYQQFIIFVILVILASLIFSFVYLNKYTYLIGENNNIFFPGIPFGYGPLITNLIENGTYLSEKNGINYNFEKLPVLPLLIFFISKITSNFYLMVILKNLITFSVLYWLIIFYLKSLKLSIHYIYFYLVIFLIPYNMFVASVFEFAECITVILLPSLFLILISKVKKKYFIASLIIFILYLTKTSMLFVSLMLPIIIVILNIGKNFKEKTYFIFLGPTVAILIWATFGYIKAGRILIGTDILSVNSIGLSIASDERFFEFYPNKSMDLLESKIKYPKELKTEWDIFDYHKKKNKEYFSDKKNVKNYLFTFPKKIMILLFYIKRDSAHPNENGIFKNPIRYSLIPNKIFINISILLSFFSIIKSLKKRKLIHCDLIFISMLFLSLLPLIAGWATAKHIVPISVLCFFYIVHKIFVFKKIIK